MKKTKLHMIVGFGEIGKALNRVLDDLYEVIGLDSGDEYDNADGKTVIDVMHICFPYSKKFVFYVNEYIELYCPKLVIIHSSIPVGTTIKIGDIAVHSPVRGVHPNLEGGIRTFVKYFGGKQARKAARYFSDIGVPTKCYKDAKTTEAGKLLSTTYYGWLIAFQRYVKEYCEANELDYQAVYEHFNNSYRVGYKELNMEYVVRPTLKAMPGKIGGHCVIPNAKILKDEFRPAKLILSKNNKL